MSRSRFRKLEHLFDQVVDLDPSERGRVVGRACADDPGLREELEALLAHNTSPLADNPALCRGMAALFAHLLANGRG